MHPRWSGSLRDLVPYRGSTALHRRGLPLGEWTRHFVCLAGKKRDPAFCRPLTNSAPVFPSIFSFWQAALLPTAASDYWSVKGHVRGVGVGGWSTLSRTRATTIPKARKNYDIGRSVSVSLYPSRSKNCTNCIYLSAAVLLSYGPYTSFQSNLFSVITSERNQFSRR